MKVKVTPLVSQMLLDDLGRRLWLRALAKLTTDLPLVAQDYRHNRDPDDAGCFHYPASLVEQATKRYWRLVFSVDDTQDSVLIVVGYGLIAGNI